MECKYMPRYDAQNLSKDAEKNSRIYCSHRDQKIITGALFCLALVLLISNVYLHYKCFTLSQEVAEQRKILDQEIKPKTFPISEIHDVHKRNSPTHRRRRQRRNRNVTVTNLMNTVNFLLTKPVLHLDGFNNNHRDFDRYEYVSNPMISEFCDSGCFKWPYPSVNPGNFRFEGLSTSTPHDYVIGIKIRVRGSYMIYSQVEIYGPDVSSEPSREQSPGYNLVVIRNGREKILMESRLTQDNRGQQNTDPGDPNRQTFPIDTINQQGIFNLNCGDILLLRPCEYTSDATFRIARDRSNFGLFMTNPYNRNFIGNSYDCSD